MSNKSQKALNRFYRSVYWYVKQEYKPKYSILMKKYKGDIIGLISPLYWGGENVPNVASETIHFFHQMFNKLQDHE